jgi:hypothetical protein
MSDLFPHSHGPSKLASKLWYGFVGFPLSLQTLSCFYPCHWMDLLKNVSDNAHLLLKSLMAPSSLRNHHRHQAHSPALFYHVRSGKNNGLAFCEITSSLKRCFQEYRCLQ